MTKKIILMLTINITLHAAILDFYKQALTTLQYNQKYELNTKANQLSQSGVYYDKYANFSLNADYSKTKAKALTDTFDTTDIALSDTLDLFGKHSYKIDALALYLKSHKSLLNIQKEQLFISLVNMIALYHKTLEQLSLYKTVFIEQKNIYDKLEKLQRKGAITSIDLLRFKNQLTSFKMRIITQENEILKMKKQLNLYAPNQQIPKLKNSKLLFSEEAFINRNPRLKLNKIDAEKLLLLSQGLEHSHLPDATVGAAYQQLGDPTSFGNNYSFSVGLKIPLNAGNFKEAEALKVHALRLKSQNIDYTIQRKNEYIRRSQAYKNALKQLKVLDKNLEDYEKSEKTVKTAYLRQYVDFNTYMQVLLQTLHIKEQIIETKYKKELEATIVNSVASGIIYE